jgi:hypothetical protein
MLDDPVVRDHPMFASWVERHVPGEITVLNMKVVYKKMFGPNLGFAGLDVTSHPTDHPELTKTWFALLSADAVGIFIVVNKKWFVVFNQPRMLALKNQTEIPVGILEDNDILGEGIRAAEEETGTKINPRELMPLSVITPSIGRSTERVLLFGTEITLTQDKIDSMLQKTHGVADERIRAQLVALDDSAFLICNDDPKILVAHARYHILKAQTQ